MRFHRPSTIDEAVTLLAADPETRLLAGGATLVALMNARLVEPAALVSLAAIDELTRFERSADGSVRIGAMRRHRETAFESDFRDGQRVVAEAAAQIANPPVRNMGTIGGSISFADPAADYPAALVAADASVEMTGTEGRRSLAAADFFVDWYTTALAPGEMVTAVRLPAAPPGSVGVYEKLARVSGDFAVASVAAVVSLRDGACASIRLAVGACGPAPVRLEAAEDRLVGTALDADDAADAGAMLAAACDPVDDVRASEAYRRAVVPRLVVKTLARAKAEAVS